MLLDEGDALVERRQRGQFLINSMSAVLLRLLEGFSGALFITSNRAAAFDPAALSRVTLAIRFLLLDTAGKRQVWRGWLVRVFAAELVSGRRRGQAAAEAYVDAGFDLDALAQFTGSGRSVGACVRLAIALAEERQTALTNDVLADAISVWSSFWRDLDDEGVSHSWDEGSECEAPTPAAAAAASHQNVGSAGSGFAVQLSPSSERTKQWQQTLRAAGVSQCDADEAASVFDAQAVEPDQLGNLSLDVLQGIGIKLGVALRLVAAGGAARRKPWPKVSVVDV